MIQQRRLSSASWSRRCGAEACLENSVDSSCVCVQPCVSICKETHIPGCGRLLRSGHTPAGAAATGAGCIYQPRAVPLVLHVHCWFKMYC